MSKSPIPFTVGDISALARSLKHQLSNSSEPPSHLELLNMLAKAAGYTNYQHFKAQAETFMQGYAPSLEKHTYTAQDSMPPADVEASEATSAPEISHKRVTRCTRYFTGNGILTRWPKRFTDRMLCLWVMWTRIPSESTLSESSVNETLGDNHLFGDHALLRRLMVDYGMLERTEDGSQYTRKEVPPPPEALELFARLKRQ